MPFDRPVRVAAGMVAAKATGPAAGGVGVPVMAVPVPLAPTVSMKYSAAATFDPPVDASSTDAR